jgi:hypothetical protein
MVTGAQTRRLTDAMTPREMAIPNVSECCVARRRHQRCLKKWTLARPVGSLATGYIKFTSGRKRDGSFCQILLQKSLLASHGHSRQAYLGRLAALSRQSKILQAKWLTVTQWFTLQASPDAMSA